MVSRNSVYVNGIDFLLAINVQSEIIGKSNRLVYLFIFGVWHGDFLEVGTNIEIHNNGLLGESEI